LRLRIPTSTGSIPGPIVPAAGRAPDSFQAGFGMTLGRWCDDQNTRGLEAGLYLLGGNDLVIDGIAPGMLVVFPDGPSESAPQVIVLPPRAPLAGIFPVTLSTWYITSDVNYRHILFCSPSGRIDALAGYRYAYLQDEMFLGKPPTGTSDEYLNNRVAVSNSFHGGQIGLAGEYRANDWYVSGTAKVAIGAVNPHLCVSGLFVNAEGQVNGGWARLAALGSSTGSRFAVLSAMNASLGRQISEHARLYIGYSFQYLSQAVRLGDVMSPAASSLEFTNFWVQSVNAGFELRY
jgi:hypothetical protein